MASLKRGYLIGLMSLVGLAALFTIGAIVSSPSSGRWIDMAIMSAIGVGYLLLLGFAAFAAFDRWGWCIPAIAGAGLSALMMLLSPLFIYVERTSSHRYPRPWSIEFFSKMTATGMTTAGLLCLGSFVLSMPMS